MALQSKDGALKRVQANLNEELNEFAALNASLNKDLEQREVDLKEVQDKVAQSLEAVATKDDELTAAKGELEAKDHALIATQEDLKKRDDEVVIVQKATAKQLSDKDQELAEVRKELETSRSETLTARRRGRELLEQHTHECFPLLYSLCRHLVIVLLNIFMLFVGQSSPRVFTSSPSTWSTAKTAWRTCFLLYSFGRTPSDQGPLPNGCDWSSCPRRR